MCADERLWRLRRAAKSRADLDHWMQVLLGKAAALNAAPPARRPRQHEPAPAHEERAGASS